MKKALSLLLTLCLAFCLCIPVFAEDVKPEDAAFYHGLDGDQSAYLYLRLDAAVRGISDALCATFVSKAADKDDPACEFEPIQTVLPCAENGDRLELWIACTTYFGTLTVRGLTDKNGGALERSVDLTEYGMHSLKLSVKNDESEIINTYLGEPSSDMNWCLVGGEITLSLYVPDALRSRIQVIGDGVELQEKKDDVYTVLSSGTGTVTLRLADGVQYTKRLCVQTKKERRDLLLTQMKAHPEYVKDFWAHGILGVTTLVTFPFSYFFIPLGKALGALTAPIAYAAEFVRVWLMLPLI